jgi:hypothetical protein
MGEAGIAATWAYKMGQTIERIGVRHFERDAQAGIRSREGREKLTQSQAAEVEDNRAKFLAAYRGHRKDKVSHSGAIERAAQEVGISSPTAWRYAKALKLGKKKPAK